MNRDKISFGEISEIKKYYNQGVDIKSIAAAFKTTPLHVTRIVNGLARCKVPDEKEEQKYQLQNTQSFSIKQIMTAFLFTAPLKKRGFYYMSIETRNDIRNGCSTGYMIIPPCEKDYLRMLEEEKITEQIMPSGFIKLTIKKRI